MDSEEMKNAIKRAKYGADRYKEHMISPNDAWYWQKKYEGAREEAWTLQRRCWELRDQLLELKESIRQIIDKVGK